MSTQADTRQFSWAVSYSDAISLISSLVNESDQKNPRPGVAADHQTLIAPCRDLQPGDPFTWLKMGWKDYWAVPGLSLAYGCMVFIASAAISLLAWTAGGWVLLLTLLTVFVFVSPLLAFALYSVPRQLDAGNKASLKKTFRAARRPFQNAMLFGLVLLIVDLIWARAGSMVHVFFPVTSSPSSAEVATFLMIGSAVGLVFAAFSFAASAFSLPMLANRDVDVVTAVISSINAVMRNKFTAAVWAALIVTLTVLGIATGLLGLIIVIPWLAFATWHGYRQALICDHWPALKIPEGKRVKSVNAVNGEQAPAE